MVLLPAALALPLHHIHYTHQRPVDSGEQETRHSASHVGGLWHYGLWQSFSSAGGSPQRRGGALSGDGPDRFKAGRQWSLKGGGVRLTGVRGSQ